MANEALPQFIDSKTYAPVFTTEWLTHQDELCFTRIRVEEGQCVFRAEEEHRYTYHVERGLVRLYLSAASGNIKTLFYHAEGTQFGFQGFRDDRLTRTTAAAVVPSTLLAIDYADLFAFCDKHPSYYRAYTAYLFQIMNSQTTEIANLSFQTGMRRLAALLHALAARGEGLGRPSEGQRADAIEIPYSIDQLAEIIGAHRNTVSNALGLLRKLGFVTNRPRPIEVCNLAGLRRYLEEEG